MTQGYEEAESLPLTREDRAAHIGEILTMNEQGEYDQHATYLYARTVSLIVEDQAHSATWDMMHSNMVFAAFHKGDSALATACLEAIENPATAWKAYVSARRQNPDILQVGASALLGEALPTIEAADKDESELDIRLAQLEVQLLDGLVPRKSDITDITNLWRHLGKGETGISIELSRLFAENGQMKQARSYFKSVRQEMRASDPNGYGRHRELLQLHSARLSKHLALQRFNAGRAEDGIIDTRILAWGQKEYGDVVLAKLRNLRPHDFFARYNPQKFVRVEDDFERQHEGIWSLTTLLRGGALERARAVYEKIVTSTTFDASIYRPLSWESEQPAAALLMAAYDTDPDTADAVISDVAGGQAKMVDSAVARIDNHVHGPERRTELATIERALVTGLEAIPRLPATERRLTLALSLAHMAAEAYGLEGLTKDGHAYSVRKAVQNSWELVAYTTDTSNAQRLGYLAAIQGLGIVVPSDPRYAAQRGFDILIKGESMGLKQRWGTRIERAIEDMLTAEE